MRNDLPLRLEIFPYSIFHASVNKQLVQIMVANISQLNQTACIILFE